MTDVNYRAEYRIKYLCDDCGYELVVPTLQKDKECIKAKCKQCDTVRGFTKKGIVSKRPGIYITKCWNCGATVSNQDAKRDGSYGMRCNACGESLRNYYGDTDKKPKKKPKKKYSKSIRTKQTKTKRLFLKHAKEKMIHELSTLSY